MDEEIRVDRAHPERRYDNRRGTIKARIPRDINKILSGRYKSVSTNFSVQRNFTKEARGKKSLSFASRKELLQKTEPTVKVAVDPLIVDSIASR